MAIENGLANQFASRLWDNVDRLSTWAEVFREGSDDGKPSYHWLCDNVSWLAGAIQASLLESIVIAICRLADPPQQGRYANASLLRVREFLSASGCERLDRFVAIAAIGKEARDKFVSHVDMDINTTTIFSPAEATEAAGVARQIVEEYWEKHLVGTFPGWEFRRAVGDLKSLCQSPV